MMKLVIFPFLVPLLLGSSVASAAFDQSGYPARCSFYRVCELETCIDVFSLPFSPVVLLNDDGEFSLVSSDMNERFNVGYFKTLESAQEYVASIESREFSAVIIPDDEVADAFGIDLRAIQTFGNRGSKVSDTVTKLSCGRIAGGLY